jgi:hypothetical protein
MPCSPLKVNRRLGESCRLHLQGRRIGQARNQLEVGSKQAYSSTLKMESTCYSEASVDFQRTTRRYIPEDRTFHNHRCENLKSYRDHKAYIPAAAFQSYKPCSIKNTPYIV